MDGNNERTITSFILAPGATEADVLEHLPNVFAAIEGALDKIDAGDASDVIAETTPDGEILWAPKLARALDNPDLHDATIADIMAGPD